MSIGIQAKVLSINIGRKAPVTYQNKQLLTGIYKQPTEGSINLTLLNFDGDEQADLQYHGGRDKAVCVYPSEHYAHWSEVIGAELTPGAFGENITTQHLLEPHVYIGDIYRLGSALVQVSQPRQPCFKLSVKWGQPKLPLYVQTTGYTGYYFRVLQEGSAAQGDELHLQERVPNSLSIQEANLIMYDKEADAARIRSLLDVPALSDSWRYTLTKRLEK
ncbi:MOSC domain-containing protein [Paenibacillus sp. GCM10023252]|uniref:MOSC domain-containing protein n=1 Tax=Paenibacillus sp. GCM10023252 TaxID=3252649 RepID=UPI00360C26FC